MRSLQYAAQTAGVIEYFWRIERISQARAVVSEPRWRGGRLR